MKRVKIIEESSHPAHVYWYNCVWLCPFKHSLHCSHHCNEIFTLL